MNWSILKIIMTMAAFINFSMGACVEEDESRQFLYPPQDNEVTDSGGDTDTDSDSDTDSEHSLNLTNRVLPTFGDFHQFRTFAVCQIDNIAFLHPCFMPDDNLKSEFFGVDISGFISGEDY